MAKTEVPFEKDYRHWKEKFEMAERRHASEAEAWKQTTGAWQNHALILGAVVRQILGTSR